MMRRGRTVGLLLLILLAAGLAPARGRSPWVFRLILDDKTRMVVAALADDLWIAFNPANAAIERAWSGDIDYRGKVWDFSQDNSTTRGTTYLAASGTVLQAPSPASMTDAWTARDVIEFDGVWRFMATDATLTLPVVDLSGTRDVMLSFDEWSRGGSFRVEVSVEWTAQRGATGGRRPWWICPRCARRCALVYLRRGVWACRRCHRLTYASTREDEFARACRRLRRIRRKMGDPHPEAGPPDALPAKQSGMHYRTWHRLIMEFREAQMALWRASAEDLERLAGALNRALGL